MKKTYRIFTLIIISILLFTSCGSNSENNLKETITSEKSDSDKNNKGLSDEKIEDIDINVDLKDLPKKYERVKIAAAGDVMTHLPTTYNYKLEDGGYDFTKAFSYIKYIFDDADLSMLNLETVIDYDKKPMGFPRFNAPREIVDGIKYAGIDLIGTANNHSLDQGTKGVLDTINSINDLGLSYIGTNLEESSDRFRIFKINDINVGVIAYTYGLNGLTPDADFRVNVIDKEKIKEDIEGLKAFGADKIIMFIHWGSEYTKGPNEYLENLGHEILDLGVDYILGSHPHVVHKVEKVGDDKFIVYSMGNFISNMRGQYFEGDKRVEDGLIVTFELVKDTDTGKVKYENLELIPTYNPKESDERHKILPVYQALDGQIPEIKLTDELRKNLDESRIRTEKTLYVGE